MSRVILNPMKRQWQNMLWTLRVQQLPNSVQRSYVMGSLLPTIQQERQDKALEAIIESGAWRILTF